MTKSTHLHLTKEYFITHFIVLGLILFLSSILPTKSNTIVCFVLLGIDVAVLYDLYEKQISQYNLSNQYISIVPLKINVVFLWLLPFLVTLWLCFCGDINYYIELIFSVTMLATMLATTLWSIPQFKKLGLSRIWSFFIYIPFVRLWILHITIKALNEKIKKAQLN